MSELSALDPAPAWLNSEPLKADGLTCDPENPRRAWVAIDPDDTEVPSRLYEIELVGPW